MKIQDYWPTSNNVKECILTEAETLPEAVFLAVHRKMRFEQRPIGPGGSTSAKAKSEDELLQAFLSDDLPSGTLLIPIVGDSGAGKSHAIRWLDIRLRHRPDRNRRHVIRIPKGSSLKQVLKLILDGLEGPKYDTVRQELLRARERMDHLDAKETLRAKLLVALERAAREASERIARARQAGDKPAEADRSCVDHCGAKGLQALISDPVAAQQFMSDGPAPGSPKAGVLSRLAHGLTADTHYENVTDRQFTQADLILRDEINMSELGAPARHYNTYLQRSDGKYREAALGYLNKVQDAALYQLLDMGENRLTTLFEQVRVNLLAEDCELVLLVEDFAALAGIQLALLDVTIKEAVRDGKQVLCHMRTALAVTEGYIPNRDTVATRARFEWRLQTDAAELAEASVDLVGRYLNAARVGRAELTRSYSHQPTAGFPDVPKFGNEADLEDQERTQLRAFGYSNERDRKSHPATGFPLFPYNPSAVGELSQFAHKEAGRTDFNPRVVINAVLRDVLLEGRAEFLQGSFPPASFKAAAQSQVDPDMRSEIQKRVHDESLRRRHFVLVRFWGANAIELSKLHLSAAVYEAFGLFPLAADAVPAPPLLVSPNAIEVQVPKPIVSPDNPLEERDQALLDEIGSWGNGGEMGQNAARELRNRIAKAVESWVDPDQFLLKKIELTGLARRIFLPRARGGVPGTTPSSALIVVCDEADVNDPARATNVLRTLRAVVRYHGHENWNYARADDDMPLYANAVEHWARQAVEYVLRKPHGVEADFVPALAQAMLFGARALDVGPVGQADGASMLASLFASAKSDAATARSNPPSPWDQLRRSCLEHREELKDALLQQVAARQGGAKAVYAVDLARVQAAIDPMRSAWQMSAPVPEAGMQTTLGSRLESHLKDLKRIAPAAVQTRRSELRKIRQTIADALGTEFDKQSLADLMLQTLEEGQRLSVVDSDVDVKELRGQIAAFRDAPVKESLEQLGRLDSPDDTIRDAAESADGQATPKASAGGFVGASLAALARVDDTVLLAVITLIDDYGKFVRRASRLAESQMATSGPDVLKQLTTAITNTLDDVAESATQVLGHAVTTGEGDQT